MSDTVLTIQQVQRAALEAWRADQSVFSRSQESAKALGEALVKVHKAVGERGFKPWLKANAIDRNRAYYCVRLVNGKGPKAKAVAKHRGISLRNGMLIRWKGDDGTLRIKDGNLDRENMRIVLNVDRVAESEPQTETSPPIEIQPELTGKYRYRFNVQELQKRLRQLSAVVAQKAQEPTYFNVRLSSDAAGAVTLRGIDLDTTLTVKLAAASADGASSILLDYKKLNSIVQSFKTKEAYISFDDEKSVSIAAGSYKSTVRGSTCEVFEQLSVVQAITNNPEIGGYTIGLPELKEQIEQVSFSIPKADGRFPIPSALLECTPDTLRLVTTDGVGEMIAISSIFPLSLGEFYFTLPRRLTVFTVRDERTDSYDQP